MKKLTKHCGFRGTIIYPIDETMQQGKQNIKQQNQTIITTKSQGIFIFEKIDKLKSSPHKN